MASIGHPRLDDPAVITRITETVRHLLVTSSTPGAAVALLVDGQPLFVSPVGFCDLAQTIALDEHAQFYIYSVTKSLLATVILQLVEQNLLVLDAPVQVYLPQLPLDTPVTLRQLLHHTGGVPDYGGLPAYFAALKTAPTQPWTPAAFLAATLPMGLQFAPSQAWQYSNIGFLLLRQVIETILQTSLRVALQTYIFAPLDLKHTFVAETLEDARLLTPGYSAFFTADNTLQDVRAFYHPGWVSHGVVIATAADLASILDAIFTGRLLNPQSRAAMLEAVDVALSHPLFQQPAYGLGLMIDRAARNGILVGHGGGGPGYSAAALHLPDVHGRRITSIALANRDQDELGLRIAFAVAMLVGDTLAA